MKTCVAAIVLGLFSCLGCATGDSDGVVEVTDAALGASDTLNLPFPDGRIDGNPQSFPDASLPGFPDAAPPIGSDGGLFPGACTSAADCPMDQCCFTLIGICVDGEEIPVLGCIPE